MLKNVGSIDRAIRIVFGIIFLAFFFIFDSGLKYVSILGLIFLITAFLRFCPLYKIVGVNTCKK